LGNEGRNTLHRRQALQCLALSVKLALLERILDNEPPLTINIDGRKLPVKDGIRWDNCMLEVNPAPPAKHFRKAKVVKKKKVTYG
jgi:hypothetical protein